MTTWRLAARRSVGFLGHHIRKVWGLAIRRMSRDTGWVREQANAIVKHAEPISWKSRRRRLALPSWRPIGWVTLALTFSLLFSWVLFVLSPTSFGISGDHLLSMFSAMWGVQVSIAAVALPILLFAIELSRDERQTAIRSHEVLIRETWILPIIAISMAGTVRIGLDMVWFPSFPVFVIDLVFVFILTIFLALFAYVRALALLFSPVRMKARAMSVAREKMNETLTGSIETRLANGRLFASLSELRVGYWPFTPERGEDLRFLAVRATREGEVKDINVKKLEVLVRSLPWKARLKGAELYGQDITPLPRGRALGEECRVWMMRKVGDRVTKKYGGLLRLEISAFSELDVRELERDLNALFRIGRSDAEN